MNTTQQYQNAVTWIEEQDTKFARTLREKAKLLVGTLTVSEQPHPTIWWEVCAIAYGNRD